MAKSSQSREHHVYPLWPPPEKHGDGQGGFGKKGEFRLAEAGNDGHVLVRGSFLSGGDGMSYAEKQGRPRRMGGRMSRVSDNLAQASAGGKQVRPLEAVGDHGCDGTVPPAAARMSPSVRSRSGVRSFAQENGRSSGLALGEGGRFTSSLERCPSLKYFSKRCHRKELTSLKT